MSITSKRRLANVTYARKNLLTTRILKNIKTYIRTPNPMSVSFAEKGLGTNACSRDISVTTNLVRSSLQVKDLLTIKTSNLKN